MGYSREDAKLAKLVQVTGYPTLEALVCAVFSDAPAICMNDGCNFLRVMELDEERGWCWRCLAYSMKSVMILAGVL